MELAEAIEVLKKGGEVTEEVKAALSAFDPSNIVDKGAVDRAAHAARKEAEAKAKEAVEQIEKLQAQVKELEDAKNGVKKSDEAKFEILQKQIAQLTETVQAKDKEAAQMARDAKLTQIVGSAKFHPKNCDGDYARHLLSERLKDLDTDDLANASLVTPILEQLRKEKPSLFAAETPTGTGLNESGGGGGGVRQVNAAELQKLVTSGDLAEAEKTMAEINKAAANEGVEYV
jgi:DNA repair exonuclease SbcCD ATPase subunit